MRLISAYEGLKLAIVRKYQKEMEESREAAAVLRGVSTPGPGGRASSEKNAQEIAVRARKGGRASISDKKETIPRFSSLKCAINAETNTVLILFEFCALFLLSTQK